MQDRRTGRGGRAVGRGLLRLLRGGASEPPSTVASIGASTGPRDRPRPIGVEPVYPSRRADPTADDARCRTATAGLGLHAVGRVGGVVELSWHRPAALDASNAELFRHWAIAAAPRCPRVVVNLANVRAVDPTGAGVLVDLLGRLARGGGGLKLAAPVPRVRAMLDVTCLARAFSIYPSADDAVAAFAPAYEVC